MPELKTLSLTFHLSQRLSSDLSCSFARKFPLLSKTRAKFTVAENSGKCERASGSRRGPIILLAHGFSDFLEHSSILGLQDTKCRVRPILNNTGINEPDIPQGYDNKRGGGEC